MYFAFVLWFSCEFFCFKEKTAYDMRISDWSSDVCASDLSSGSDVTLVAYGPLVATAKDVVLAAADDGVSIELIDLRSLSPIDFETVEASVRQTAIGRAACRERVCRNESIEVVAGTLTKTNTVHKTGGAKCEEKVMK